METNASGFDFSKRPFLVIWETTRACDLACLHCRASADPNPAPDELNHGEALLLIEEVRAMGTPILIFSGGDPLKRRDLEDMIRFAKTLRLRTGVIPAVTSALTPETIFNLKACGLDQLAMSLDAASADEHDSFRRVDGVFEHTMDCIRWANACGLPVQINSLVNVHNTDKLEQLIRLIETLDIVFWEVFFLVPVGRGSELPLMSAEKFEHAFEKIYELSQRVGFIIKVTEAPHYRRFCIEKEKGAAKGVHSASRHSVAIKLPAYLRKSQGPRGSIGMAPSGVNAGKGFIFISHRGEVYPSGFLPLSAGNVRRQSLKEIYQNSPLLQELRDVSALKGRCGICPYKELCGGSRSRAYALTNDYLAEDPCCSYNPVPGQTSFLEPAASENNVLTTAGD